MSRNHVGVVQVSSTSASAAPLLVASSGGSYTGNLLRGETATAEGTGFNLLSMSSSGAAKFRVRACACELASVMLIATQGFAAVAEFAEHPNM